MSKTNRTITTALWGLVVIGLLALIAMQRQQSRQAARAADINDPAIKAQLAAGHVLERASDGTLQPATQRADPYVFAAPTFHLTDQDSKPFDSESLKGKVWTASFFFSKCQGVCPGMMGRIKALSTVIDSPEAHFVYFTVNPSEDTPERLHEYATAANADSARWHMLTGADEEMKRIAAAFKLPYRMPAEHSGKIMLVDQKGDVQGFYESKDNAEMMQLAKDVKKLAAGEAIR